MNLEEIYARIVVWPIIIGGLACFGILFYQGSKFLQIGVWQSVSVIDALRYFGSEWAHSPNTWLGVHKILDFLPMSIGGLILGFLPLILAVLIAKSDAQ
jgi:hypothetical protein